MPRLLSMTAESCYALRLHVTAEKTDGKGFNRLNLLNDWNATFIGTAFAAV